jgi:peptide/nickel transport system substrate-binding protein
VSLAVNLSRRGRQAGALAACALGSLLAADAALAYQEAPMLAERVAAGELPPVDERLPAEPLVVTPIEEVGTYGGTLRRVLIGPSGDHNTILRIVGPQSLVRWKADYSGLEPNLATSWEISDDAREYTFHLREGLKWSDGHPLTTEDIRFFVEDLLNSDFYGSPPVQFVSGGETVAIETPDDYTAIFKFKEPNGLFLYDLASPYGAPPVLWAKHYCSQFHPKYNPDIEALMAEYNQPNWVDLYKFRCGTREKGDRWYNPEKPTLEPWVIKEPYTGGATQVVLERNPYFWQVDPEGNQLPYIDSVHYQIVQNPEAAILAGIGGQVDMQVEHFNEIQNRPVLLENQEKGDYRVIPTVPTASSEVIIWPNLVHRDPKVRALLNNKEFRKALSHAINRQEIIDLVLLGQGEPWQIGPPRDNALFNDQLATQFTAFDPDEANRILDEIGFDQRDAGGFRLDADGKRITLFTEYNSKFGLHGDVLELVAKYWNDVGIATRIEAIDNNFFQARNANGEAMIQITATNGGGLDAIWRPTDFVPLEDDSRFGVAWAFWWLSNGEDGEEPPPEMLERLKAYDQVKRTPPGPEQEKLMRKVLQMAADGFEVWGISTPAQGQGIVKSGLRNVPDAIPYGFIYLTPQPTMPATYSWAQ